MAKTKKAQETQAAETNKVAAFKGFDKNLQCRGFQYEVGQTYEHAGDVEACASGFHACESPFDVWSYYGPHESRFCSVELSGELSRHEEDSKIAAARIAITAELSLPQIITAGIDYLMGLCKAVTGVVVADSGHSAQIGSSGDSARIGSSGHYARIDASGAGAVVACAGIGATVRSGAGGAVSIAYHDGKRTRFAVGYVGENIKPMTWYSVNERGEFVEAQL